MHYIVSAREKGWERLKCTQPCAAGCCYGDILTLQAGNVVSRKRSNKKKHILLKKNSPKSLLYDYISLYILPRKEKYYRQPPTYVIST
jgi:hypothetical protein